MNRRAKMLSIARRIYESLSLGVHPANARAIRLYQRVGFVQFAAGAGGYLNMVLRFNRAEGSK